MKELILEILKPDPLGRRITQKELAEKLGVGENVVSGWVNGKTKPSGHNIEKIVGLGLIDPALVGSIIAKKK